MNSASSVSVLCVSALALGCGIAQAAAPATAAEPEVTTVTYGDWVVRCQQAAGAARQCEALQTLAIDGRAVARIAVGRVAPNGDLAVAVNLPSNVAFTAPLTLGSETKAAPQLVLGWRRCLPNGCFADVTPAAAVFAQWQGQTVPGALGFVDGNGNAVAMPFSFRGLSQAIEGLGGK